MAFENLDVAEASCFGYMRSRRLDWVDAAELSEKIGWRRIDRAALEEGMALNVDASYGKICSFLAKDPATGFSWRACFDNQDALWELSIEGSPDAEVQPEQKKEFFASEAMEKAALRAVRYVARAVRVYERTVRRRLEEGELMKVDPVRLEAILAWAGNPRNEWTGNLMTRKFRF